MKSNQSNIIKLLFISHNRHQNNYFKQLIDKLHVKTKLIKSPFCLDIFSTRSIYKKLNIDEILKIKFKEIDIKYKNSFHKLLYKFILKVQTPFIASGYIKEIKKDDVNMVVLWNGKKYPQNMAVELTKLLDKQTLFFENGALPNTTAMDFYGLNATATIPKDVNIYENYEITELPKKLVARKEEKKRIKEELELPDKYIFVPFQVSYDSQLIYHSPWIKTMEELFDNLDMLSKKLKINFILKEHPSDKKSDFSSLHKKAKENEYISFANSYNTQELIEKSDVVLTINSSVGIEAMLFNKRVIVIGDAFYSIEGLTKQAKSTSELEKVLEDLDTWTNNKELTDKFLSYIKEEYLIPQSWRNPNPEHFEKINKKLEAFINDKTEL